MRGQVTLESLIALAVYFAIISVVMSYAILMKRTVQENQYIIEARRIAESTAFRLDMQANDLPAKRAEQGFVAPPSYKGHVVYYEYVGKGGLVVTIAGQRSGAQTVHPVHVMPYRGGMVVQTTGEKAEPI